MPVLDGIETLRILKNQSHTKDIPVVMYTGIMMEANNLKIALEAGACEFLRKPIAGVELLARINSILTLRQIEKEKNEIKARELTSLTLQITQKNNFLLHLDENLNEIKKTHPETIQAIHKLQHAINLNLEDENQWEIIKKRINGVYQGFFSRLIALHADLTTGEIRLAALLKINLSNKEIASILNISPKGLEKSRSRLRKKINLDKADSMESYILAI
jgi:FixJ family two-component response regulator